MKKPLNNGALALFVLAIAYAMLLVPDLLEILRQPVALQAQSLHRDASYVQSFNARDVITAFRNTLYGSGVLFGLAIMVELIDRVRWNAIHKDNAI